MLDRHVAWSVQAKRCSSRQCLLCVACSMRPRMIGGRRRTLGWLALQQTAWAAGELVGAASGTIPKGAGAMALRGGLTIGVDATTWWNQRGFGRFTRGQLGAMLEEAAGAQVRAVCRPRTGREDAPAKRRDRASPDVRDRDRLRRRRRQPQHPRRARILAAQHRRGRSTSSGFRPFIPGSRCGREFRRLSPFTTPSPSISPTSSCRSFAAGCCGT